MQSIESAIDRAISIFGSEVLEEKDVLWNAVEDLIPYHAADFSFYVKLYDADLGKKLKEAYSARNTDNQYYNAILDHLLEVVGISEKKAHQFVSFFSFLRICQSDGFINAVPLKETFSCEIAKGAVLGPNYTINTGANYKSEVTTETLQKNNASLCSSESPNEKEAGLLFEKNVPELLKWAESGNVFCEYYMGTFCKHRQNDYKGAFNWWKKASDKGYARAMFELGMLYEAGEGTAQDLSLALELYKKAVKNPALSFVQINIASLEAKVAEERAQKRAQLELSISGIEKIREKASIAICEVYGKGFDFWRCVMDDPYNIEKVFYDTSSFKNIWMDKINLDDGKYYEKNRNDMEYIAAKKYMKDKQYEQAVKMLLNCSKKGLRAADFYLGKYYRELYEEAASRSCIEGTDSPPRPGNAYFYMESASNCYCNASFMAGLWRYFEWARSVSFCNSCGENRRGIQMINEEKEKREKAIQFLSKDYDRYDNEIKQYADSLLTHLRAEQV